MTNEIWSPARLYKYLAVVGMPAEPHAYATKNFSWQELLTKQKEPPTTEVLENLLKVATVIQRYRDTVFRGAAITITSGWRSYYYNQTIGGAKKSFHVQGLALDFVVSGYTPQQVQHILDPVHKGGLEFAETWTHIDIRPENIRFDSNGKVFKIGDFHG